MTTDPADRASLLDDLIGSLQAAGDVKAVIAAVTERISLSARVHDTPTRVAELAFDADEGDWTKNSTPAFHAAALRRHAESPLLNTRRRVRAARMLMIAADADIDCSLARYTAAICENMIPDNPTSQLLLGQISLIYHTIFGDPDQALQIADQIESDTMRLERSWYTLTAQRNCAFSRQLASFGPSDYRSLERGYAQALDASMTTVALAFAAYLAAILIDDGDLAGAHAWVGHCEALAKSFDRGDLPIDYLGAQVDLSLLKGNCREAARYVDLMEQCAPRYQSIRSRNDLMIYRMRVQQHCGKAPGTPERLQELLRFHEIGKRFTRHDDHMEVLWTTLNQNGESERASLLLTEYLLHHRRERRPCRYFLRTRTQDDPAWKQP